MKTPTLGLLLLSACGSFSPAPTVTETRSEIPPPAAGTPGGSSGPTPHPPEPRDPPRPGLSVTSIAIAANAQADAVLYTLTCTDCIVPGTDAETVFEPDAVTASVRLYTPREGGTVNPLYENKKTRAGQTNVIAVAAAGDTVWALLTGEKGGLSTVAAPFVPGGSVITAAVSASRQTNSSSFGSMVRSGTAVGHTDGSAHFLLAGEAGLATLLTQADTQATLTSIGPADADIGVIAQAGDHLALAYHRRNEGVRDSEVTVLVGDGIAPAVTPMLGVPAALWSNGTDFKVVVKMADSLAVYWDGTTRIDLPRSDEAACTAVAFSPAGELVFLSAGPQSAVLWAVSNGLLAGPKVLSARDHAGPATSACAASFGKELLHVAWAEDDAFIQHQMIDTKTGKVELRTRHEIQKGSIQNIR